MKSVGEAMAIGRTFQETCKNACALWRHGDLAGSGLVAGMEGFGGITEAVGEGLWADDGGVRAPAQDPAFGFLDAV